MWEGEHEQIYYGILRVYSWMPFPSALSDKYVLFPISSTNVIYVTGIYKILVDDETQDKYNIVATHDMLKKVRVIIWRIYLYLSRVTIGRVCYYSSS